MRLKGVFSVVFAGQIVDEFQEEYGQNTARENIVEKMDDELLGH